MTLVSKPRSFNCCIDNIANVAFICVIHQQVSKSKELKTENEKLKLSFTMIRYFMVFFFSLDSG